ncbi:MAG TPA: hypothetical protein VGA58_03605 [bacterium]
MRVIQTSVLFTLLLVAGLGAATAEPVFPNLVRVGVVAVAPFADDVGVREGLAGWAAARLSRLLATAGVRVVPFEQTNSALLAMRLLTARLTSPTVVAELGNRLGVDAVVTGRLTRADQERGPRGDSDGIPSEAAVTFDVHVMIIATKERFSTEMEGHAEGPVGLLRATERALREFVNQWAAP